MFCIIPEHICEIYVVGFLFSILDECEKKIPLSADILSLSLKMINMYFKMFLKRTF